MLTALCGYKGLSSNGNCRPTIHNIAAHGKLFEEYSVYMEMYLSNNSLDGRKIPAFKIGIRGNSIFARLEILNWPYHTRFYSRVKFVLFPGALDCHAKKYSLKGLVTIF